MLALNHRVLGHAGPPLLFLHGLLGDGGNWHGIARRLSHAYRIALPDLRGHGASPQHPEMDVPDLVRDVETLLDELGWEQVGLVGHSLGGKVAMWLALTRPERVSTLVVADIAPVAYPDRFTRLLQALRKLPAARLQSRAQADAHLAETIPDPALRQFLLKNLAAAETGYRWRVDLDALAANLPAFMSFPVTEGLAAYDGPALFLAGGRSDYVRPEHHGTIARLFPEARVRIFPDAGHWPHVDRPEDFVQALLGFFRNTNPGETG